MERRRNRTYRYQPALPTLNRMDCLAKGNMEKGQ